MKLTESQQKLFSSDSNVISLIGGFAAGKTSAVLYKALLTTGLATVITIDEELAEYTRLELQNIGHSITNNLKLPINPDVKVITFDSINCLMRSELVILEDIDTLVFNEAIEIYHKAITFTDNIIVTGAPLSKVPLDENFLYQLSNKVFCHNISMDLRENEYLPCTYLEDIRLIISEYQYPYYLEGRFTYLKGLHYEI